MKVFCEHLKVVAENRFIYTNLTQRRMKKKYSAYNYRAFKWKIDPHTVSQFSASS